tara:strand:- start:331 stop:1920 length:1590 start_codon:yes stop_codon:yes gene_type:complete
VSTIKHKRGTTKPTASDLVAGEIAVKTDNAKLFIKNDSGHVFEVGETLGTFNSSTITYTVTVASKTSAHRYNGTGSGSGYKINGIFAPFLSLTPGNTYKFDQSDSSNSGHPLRFYLEADKTTAYTTNVTTSGTAGSSGAYTQILITDATPIILHYQCSAHGYMGNSVTSNGTSIDGSNITSGTIPDARFPATLPAVSGANLTNLPSSGGGLSSDAQKNTVGGTNAGDSFSGTDATNNTLIGFNAGTAITTADNSTAIGYFALDSCTSGNNNTVLGSNAGKSITTARESVIIGSTCGDSITTGNFNTLGGYYCGQALTTGQRNSFWGYSVGSAATTAGYNVGIGSNAFEQLSSGEFNVGIGYQAADNITYGSSNTCVGQYAGNTLSTGSNNTCLGNNAIPSAVDVSNEITLGNSSVTSLRCQVQTISSLSDARDKTDIVDSPDGLELINLLKPRKFTWAMREESENNGRTELGFIAQELDEALGDKNDYIHAVNKNNPDKLEASYSKLIPILVKAIQELTIEVKALKSNA